MPEAVDDDPHQRRGAGLWRAMLACTLGLMVAALSVAAAFWGLLVWDALAQGVDIWPSPLDPAVRSVAGLSLAFGALPAWMIGVPTLLCLRRRGTRGLARPALLGGALAVLGSGALWLGLGRHQPWRAAALLMVLAVAGALGGWAAWTWHGAPAPSGNRRRHRWLHQGPRNGPPEGRR